MPPRPKVKQAEARIAAADAAVLGAMTGAMMQKVAGPSSAETRSKGQGRSVPANPTPAFIQHTTDQLHDHLRRQQLRADGPPQCEQAPTVTSEGPGENKPDPPVTASYAY